jgi:hypothetical protein
MPTLIKAEWGEVDLLLALSLHRINLQMTTAVVDSIYAEENTLIRTGAKLFDLKVDLSAISPQDCPPVSLYRVSLRETVWLRRLVVAVGDEPAVGSHLALFSTAADESIDCEPARNVRTTTAGIISEWKPGLWDARRP